MKKLFSLFTAVLFAGSMFAADAKVVLDFTDAGWGFPSAYSKDTKAYTNGDYSVTFTAGTAGDGLKYMTVSNTDPTIAGVIFGKTNASLTLPAMSFAVGSIRVHYASTSGSGATVHNIFVGEDAVSTAETGCKLSDTKSYSEFKIAAAKQAAGTVFVLKVTSSHNMQVKKIEFFEPVVGAPEAPKFSVEAGVYSSAQSVELSCATEGAEIFYTLDGTDPTSASTKYTAAIAVSETKTIKAIAIKNEVSSDIVSATYTIVSLEGEGTKEKPYTVADLVSLNNALAAKAWVIGYIVGCAANGGELAETDAATNIALGDAADQTTGLVAVQLPTGDVRTALNVVDNPANKGKKVKLYGDLQAYFQAPGVKNTSEFEWVSDEPASDCDWDNIEFFNAGLAPEDENFNQFKICKEDELPNFVNIQTAPWANNNKGIYVNFPTAEIGAISLPADQYKIDGAGVLLFLSAFTAKVTDASIEFQGVARAFTVYNDKGTDASAIDNTAAEAKTIKAIRNGQVVIIRDGKVLNMLGVEMD